MNDNEDPQIQPSHIFSLHVPTDRRNTLKQSVTSGSNKKITAETLYSMSSILNYTSVGTGSGEDLAGSFP